MVQPCAELPPIAQPATMGDLLRFAMDTVDDYNECSARHRALADFVRTQ